MAGGGILNRPIEQTNPSAMALDRLDPMIHRLWTLKRELFRRWVLGENIEGTPIKAIREKPLKVVPKGYDFRIRVNYAGVSTAGRTEASTAYTMSYPTFYDYAIFKPRL